jgi:hypothetical protein
MTGTLPMPPAAWATAIGQPDPQRDDPSAKASEAA